MNDKPTKLLLSCTPTVRRSARGALVIDVGELLSQLLGSSYSTLAL